MDIKNDGKTNGIKTAQAFVEKYYPDCLAAALFGSVARGEATANSDLDILIITNQDLDFYRKSFRDFGWFIEAFVSSPRFNEQKIENAANNRGSSALQMYAESIILKDSDNFACNLKDKAAAILRRGAPVLTARETEEYRYIITDWLDNFMDSDNFDESLFIVYDLMAKTAELLLAYNGQWIGERKWLFRALRQFDNPLAGQLIESLKYFCQTGEKTELITTIEQILEPAGGRMYEGFSSEN